MLYLFSPKFRKARPEVELVHNLGKGKIIVVKDNWELHIHDS